MDNKEQFFKKVIEYKKIYEQSSNEHWLRYELGTWQWWVSIILLILPFIIWWKFVDRKRVYEILAYGFLTSLITVFLDVIGSELILWEYPIRIFPFTPRLLPIDYSVVPVTYMLVYQYFSKWNQYMIAFVFVALVYSFLAEPLMVKMNLYTLITWKYIYSFPIYIALATFSKGFIQWLGTNSKVKEDS